MMMSPAPARLDSSRRPQLADALPDDLGAERGDPRGTSRSAARRRSHPHLGTAPGRAGSSSRRGRTDYDPPPCMRGLWPAKLFNLADGAGIASVSTEGDRGPAPAAIGSCASRDAARSDVRRRPGRLAQSSPSCVPGLPRRIESAEQAQPVSRDRTSGRRS